MTPEQKCVSLETAKKLQAAGFPQDTERWWSAWSSHSPAEHTDCHELHWELGGEDDGSIAPRVAAPDSQELGELLPGELMEGRTMCFLRVNKEEFELGVFQWNLQYVGTISGSDGYPDENLYLTPEFVGKNEAEARATAWLWLKEKNLL